MYTCYSSCSEAPLLSTWPAQTGMEMLWQYCWNQARTFMQSLRLVPSESLKGIFPFCFWAYFTVCLNHALRPMCFPLICYHIVLNFEEHTFHGFQRMYCNYEVCACEILLCACLHAHILHELQTLCHKMFTESNPQKFCLLKIWRYMVCPSYIPPRRKQWPHYT